MAAFDVRISRAHASRQRSLAQLAYLLGEDTDAATLQRLSGDLMPEEPPPLQTLLQGVTNHPQLQNLQAQAQASELTAQAESRAAIPDVTLGVGRKELTEFGQSSDGNLISLSVNIPLFDRNQGKRAKAKAAARTSSAEYQLTLAELRGEIRGRWLQLRELLLSAKQFRNTNANSTEQLVHAAEAGYRGAEVGVLELVDAYENALDAEIRVFELQKQARDAQVDLQTLTRGAINE